MAFTLQFTSQLAASLDDVWASVRTLEGVNFELAPWVRMTAPAAVRGFTVDDAPLGACAFRSVLLAGGFFPFDVHSLTLVERGEHRFLERSPTLLQRTWEHERTVVATPGGGCSVTDRLRVEPRIPVDALVRPLVAAIFRRRHRRLRARFGAAG